MYPRNAASPEPIAIGPVVQISDGAVQTASVTVRVKPIGVTEANGGGTTDYSTDGVVLYTPTQAETNYTSFVLIAKKTGCIPASVTVVTTARSTAGEVQVGGYASGQVPLQPTVAGRTLDVSAGGEAGIDFANIGSPTTTVNLSGTTIKTATDIETDTQDIQSRLPAALVGGRMASNAEVVGDKTGYKLASDGLALVTAWTVGITGNITGNLSGSVGSVTGSVGSISGVAFPSNFGALAIDGGGAIMNVVLVDELGLNALTANGAGDPIGGYVWGALLADHTIVNSFGAKVVRSVNSNNQVEITGGGSHHIFAVIHDSEPNSIHEDAFDDGALTARVIADNAIDAAAIATGAITSAKFAADAITATVLATSAVAEITDAVALITPIADLATMITNDGTVNARYTVSALQNGPSGEGGSTINVYPVSASTPERVAGTTLTFYKNENRSVSIVTDFTLTSLTLQFVVEDAEGNDILTIADGSISRSSQTFTVTIGTTVTGTITNYKWSLRDITSGNSVLARGVLSVQDAAASDA